MAVMELQWWFHEQEINVLHSRTMHIQQIPESYTSNEHLTRR